MRVGVGRKYSADRGYPLLMADGVDSDELLRRIRVARDWAHEEEERSADKADEAAAAAYRAVGAVLDKVVDPTRH